MSESKVRSIGVFLILVSVFMAYFFVYQPIEAAKAHSLDVQFGVKGPFLVPICLMIGLLAAIFGQQGRDWIQTGEEGRQKLTPVGWVFVIVAIAAGIGLHQWAKSEIMAYGYNF
jgi:hypothetical protein